MPHIKADDKHSQAKAGAAIPAAASPVVVGDQHTATQNTPVKTLADTKVSQAKCDHTNNEVLLKNLNPAGNDTDMCIMLVQDKRCRWDPIYIIPKNVLDYYGPHNDRETLIPPAEFVDDMMRASEAHVKVYRQWHGVGFYKHMEVANSNMDIIKKIKQEKDASEKKEDKCCDSYSRISCCLFGNYYPIKYIGYVSHAVSPDGRCEMIDKTTHVGDSKIFSRAMIVLSGPIMWQGKNVTKQFHARFKTIIDSHDGFGDSNRRDFEGVGKARYANRVVLNKPKMLVVDPKTPLLTAAAYASLNAPVMAGGSAGLAAVAAPQKQKVPAPQMNR